MPAGSAVSAVPALNSLSMHISQINIYPIKSLKGISLGSATVESRGLQHDRRWMLTDKTGSFLTQREFPRMACISVGIQGMGLSVSADGFGAIKFPFAPGTVDRRQVRIWQSSCVGEIYENTVNEWFSDVLGTGCQLVYMPEDSRRRVNPRFDHGDDIVSFADGYPLMMLGEASLADLNSRLDVPLPMNRFRPNLVVDGSEAYAEDKWQYIKIGQAVFRSTRPCARCVITTVDQSKGEKAGKEPLQTLATYRMAKDVMPYDCESLGMGKTDVLFGQNLIAESPGRSIRVGDRVNVIKDRNQQERGR